MAFNGSGTFNLVSGNPVVTGTVISSTVHNNTMSDIASNGLSNCITKDGQTIVTANIPLNSQKITGLGAATDQNDAINITQVQNNVANTLGTVAGTDTITAVATPTITSYTTGQIFYFEPANNNTGPATLNIDSVGAKTIQKSGKDLIASELVSGQTVAVKYDGTQFQLIADEDFMSEARFINSPRKNAIINGNFDIWQRGTSFTLGGGVLYTADRVGANTGVSGSATASRQSFTLGQTDVPNEPEYYFRHLQSVAASSEVVCYRQRIESVRTYAGQTVTLSFYAKADAAVDLTPVATQKFGTGGTPSTDVITTLPIQSVVTTWQKFDITFDIPSISGKTIGTNSDDNLEIDLRGPDSTLWTIDIAQVQLESGEVATNFEQRSVGEELALCQRYYQNIPSFRTPATATATTAAFGVSALLPTRMRTQPTLSTSNNSATLITLGSYAASITGVDQFRLITNDSSGVSPRDSVILGADVVLDAEL